MLFKSLLAFILIIAIAFLLYLFYLGKLSRSGAAPGLLDGQLTQCPATPNCVCSEYIDDSDHYVEAIPFSGDPEATLRKLAFMVISMRGTVVSQSDRYLATTFRSSLFGFVDDVEFRIDTDNKLIHVRSASRVGRG